MNIWKIWKISIFSISKFLISHYKSNPSEPLIAQIDAYGLIKVFDFTSWGLASLGGIWGHLGSNYKNVQTWTNYIPKWSFWSGDYENVVFEVSWGHPTPNLGVFGVISGQNPKIFKPWQTIYQNEALRSVIYIKWFSRSSEVIWP